MIMIPLSGGTDKSSRVKLEQFVIGCVLVIVADLV